MVPDEATDWSDGGGRFDTTRWGLVTSSADQNSDEEKAREALGQLCRLYWRPILAYICQKGYSLDDAQDLTQDFFVLILRGKLLTQADPTRGRFRSFLLKSLQNFLIDAHAKKNAKKRGGHLQVISWDDWMAEAPSWLTLPPGVLDDWSPEKIYDLRWAATVAEQALRRLQEECERRGRRRVFDALSHFLMVERDDISYEKLASELGTGVPEVRNALHRLRQRFRQLLREEIAETVAGASEIDDELRYLVAALASDPERDV